MKILFFSLCTLLLFSAKAQTTGLSVENGTLKFSSLAVYEQYADNTLDRNNITNVTASISTLSQTESLIEESLYPEFLQKILNTDKIVRINNFLVKIDLQNHQALVIDATTVNAYSTLVSNNSSAQGVMVFSDETDNAMEVLEAIEAGSLTTANYQSALTVPEGGELFRKCSGAGRVDPRKRLDAWDRTYDDPQSQCPDQSRIYGMDNKVVYQRAIFYFSLQSKLKSLRACSSTNWLLVPTHEAQLKLVGTAKYVKVNHCNQEWNQSENTTTQGTELNWRGYQGSRALRKFDFNVNFFIKHTWEQVDYHPALNPYRIAYGY